MREKKCAICFRLFVYKNKSKKYCSAGCKQQAHRNRKKEELLKLNHGSVKDFNNKYCDKSGQSLIQKELQLSIQILKNTARQIISICHRKTVHISEILFLKTILASLEKVMIEDTNSEENFKIVQREINKLWSIATKYKTPEGYIEYRKHTTVWLLKKMETISVLF